MSEEVSMRERGMSDYEIELQAKSEELSNLRVIFYTTHSLTHSLT
jgi:hypothetical protein